MGADLTLSLGLCFWPELEGAQWYIPSIVRSPPQLWGQAELQGCLQGHAEPPAQQGPSWSSVRDLACGGSWEGEQGLSAAHACNRAWCDV